jgi:hypothetical protein
MTPVSFFDDCYCIYFSRPIAGSPKLALLTSIRSPFQCKSPYASVERLAYITPVGLLVRPEPAAASSRSQLGSNPRG